MLKMAHWMIRMLRMTLALLGLSIDVAQAWKREATNDEEPKIPSADLHDENLETNGQIFFQIYE